MTAQSVNASPGAPGIIVSEGAVRDSICRRLQSAFLHGLRCPTFARLAIPTLSWLPTGNSAVWQATRLWDAPFEEQGTLVPMADIAQRLGVGVGAVLSHLNGGHAQVRDAVAFIESHLVDAWLVTDVGYGQCRVRVPPVALPTFPLDAPADGVGAIDFYLLHIHHGDYHILLTCCEVDLDAWRFVGDGVSAITPGEARALVHSACGCALSSFFHVVKPAQVGDTFAEHAAFAGPFPVSDSDET